MRSDLYSLPIEGTTYERYCGGNLSGDHEACVVFGALPGSGCAFVVKDSKPEGVGRELRFTEHELDDFAVCCPHRFFPELPCPLAPS